MSFGKMNTFISIVEKQFTQDDEGFKTETDVTVAEVRAYREGRHGSEKWANIASFSTATDLFQFRVIPGVTDPLRWAYFRDHLCRGCQRQRDVSGGSGTGGETGWLRFK